MSEYRKIADEHFAKLRSLMEERTRIEQEINKTDQLIKAVLNMMPGEEKGPYLADLNKFVRRERGLTEAIRDLLKSYGDFLSATQIKELLEGEGYDFSSYTSNPLISIYSILKRFKPTEVEKEFWPDGVAGYRWKLDERVKASRKK